MTHLKMVIYQLGLEKYWGILHHYPTVFVVLSCLLGIVVLGYLGSYFFVWSLAVLGLLFGLGVSPKVGLFVFGALAIFNIPWIRQWLISFPLMKFMKVLKFLPTISETERIAIEAGNVWVDGELFSGKPDLRRLMKESYPELTPDEQAFIDGPCEKLCHMVDDWNVQQRRDF